MKVKLSCCLEVCSGNICVNERARLGRLIYPSPPLFVLILFGRLSFLANMSNAMMCGKVLLCHWQCLLILASILCGSRAAMEEG